VSSMKNKKKPFQKYFGTQSTRSLHEIQRRKMIQETGCILSASLS